MPVRVWAKSDDGRFEWVTLSAKYLSQAIEVYRNSFYTNENVSKVTEIAKTEKGCKQFDELLTEIAQDGVSVIGVEVATGKVVGAGFTKLTYKGNPEMPILERYYHKEGVDPGFKELLRFMFKMEEKVDIFELYGANTLMDFMFLATHSDYYRLGIGLKTVSAAAALATALYNGEDVVVPLSEEKFPWKNIPPPKPEILIALFTSSNSQGIGKKLGWDTVVEGKYDEFFYEGKSYASRLDKNNRGCLYMCTRIAKK